MSSTRKLKHALSVVLATVAEAPVKMVNALAIGPALNCFMDWNSDFGQRLQSDEAFFAKVQWQGAAYAMFGLEVLGLPSRDIKGELKAKGNGDWRKGLGKVALETGAAFAATYAFTLYCVANKIEIKEAGIDDLENFVRNVFRNTQGKNACGAAVFITARMLMTFMIDMIAKLPVQTVKKEMGEIRRHLKLLMFAVTSGLKIEYFRQIMLIEEKDHPKFAEFAKNPFYSLALILPIVAIEKLHEKTCEYFEKLPEKYKVSADEVAEGLLEINQQGATSISLLPLQEEVDLEQQPAAVRPVVSYAREIAFNCRVFTWNVGCIAMGMLGCYNFVEADKSSLTTEPLQVSMGIPLIVAGFRGLFAMTRDEEVVIVNDSPEFGLREAPSM